MKTESSVIVLQNVAVKKKKSLHTLPITLREFYWFKFPEIAMDPKLDI